MRAFLQCRDSDIGLEPCNYNIFNAYCGLRDMGFDLIPKKEMGTAIKYLKSKFPTANGKIISDIVKTYII